MSITFKSQATGDLFMVQAHAEALLKHIGKEVAEQGILEVADMPAALEALRSLSDDTAQAEAIPDDDGEEVIEGVVRPRKDVAFVDEPVSMRNRAWPLIKMIERAQEAGKPIVWGV